MVDIKHFKVKFGDTERDASPYQDIIFNEIKYGSHSMVISAAAGSGKTTTMVNCISLIPSDRRITFIAFNKDIVKAIESKTGRLSNVRVLTYHSLGMKILIENFPEDYKDPESCINDSKYRIYLKEHLNELTSFPVIHRLNKMMYDTYINNITHLVNYARFYMVMKEKDIAERAAFYGINLLGDEVSVCRKLLEWGCKNRQTLDFCDMIWLPKVLNLKTKRYLTDFAFIDEAQDTTLVQKELICSTFKRGARFVAVGDEMQQINLWCGASEEAIDEFRHMNNVLCHSLPISYRCPKKVIDIAKKYAPSITAADNAIDGIVRYDVSENMPVAGDMVLCRNTAPLIEYSLKLLRLNKQYVIKGCREMKRTFLELIDACDAEFIDNTMSTFDGLIPQMYRNMFMLQERLMEIYGLDEEDAMMQSAVLQMNDNIECVKVLSEGLDRTSELRKKINEVFTNDEGDGVILSTIHKAKGLEADNVYILRPSLLPSKLAKKEWEVKTERNLEYVAYTRPKKSLNFIAEPKVRYGQGVVGAASLKDTLLGIKDKIKRASDMNLSAETIHNSVDSRFSMDHLRMEMGNPNIRPTTENKPKKVKAGNRFSDILN